MEYKCQLCRDSGWINEKVTNARTRAVYGSDKKIEIAKPCPKCYPRVLMEPKNYSGWFAKYGERKEP